MVKFPDAGAASHICLFKFKYSQFYIMLALKTNLFQWIDVLENNLSIMQISCSPGAILFMRSAR